MTRVLVTAFEPFGGESVNPSQQAVQRLAAGPVLAGVELATAFRPVVFGDAIEALRAAVAAHTPDVVICVGGPVAPALSPRSGSRSPQRRAVPRQCRSAADRRADPARWPGGVRLDAAGGRDGRGDPGGRDPALESSTAGNYVCNNVFYGVMQRMSQVWWNLGGDPG